MKRPILTNRWLASWQIAAALTLAGGAAFGAHSTWVNNDSDITGVAHYTDSLAVNPWGLVTGVEGAVRVADDGTQTSTIYAADGALESFTGTSSDVHSIAIPTPSATSGGSPTGVVDNQLSLLATGTEAEGDFPITADGVTKSSQFIYCTEEGVIAGYHSSLESGTAAITGTSVDGAVYTGAALSWSGTGAEVGSDLKHQLYAANFAAGTVDVFSNTFALVSPLSTGTFADPALTPITVSGTTYEWSPFNIHDLDFDGKIATSNTTNSKKEHQHLLVVTYALHSTTGDTLNDVPEISGTYYGAVALFHPDGTLYANLGGTSGTSDEAFSSPWGVAVLHGSIVGLKPAPVTILIGNHGTGTIHAFALDTSDPVTFGIAKSIGLLAGPAGNNPLAFDHLWALRFADKKVTIKEYKASGGTDLVEDASRFYFSAGIGDELHGLVGRILLP